MNFTETELKDVYIIEPKVFGDHRGWFYESWTERDFANAGLSYHFVQDNQSYSSKKGTLRGLHFQKGEYSQAKLVRCVRGRIMDVAVDLRHESPTYLKWTSIELSAENKREFLIPRGFAHGFLTLTDDVEFIYRCDNYYSPAHEASIRFDDPDLNINWGITDPILAAKDTEAPFLKDYLKGNEVLF
ncbi:MAG: dTDP-4-dehydrorhamnose 3,5-epimerase [Lachnospiraceae bacterium]|nr:dTDP-4-dehydrorhamnose 3,5-epimerase [Lachnospiraceae bacterium]